LEFMAFTEIKTLQQAIDVVSDVAHPKGGILIDTLHSTRTGATLSQLQAIDPQWVSYLQIADAMLEPADTAIDSLIEEALYQRLLPGDGELPLNEMIAALPENIPLSAEIRSRDLISTFADNPLGRAERVYQGCKHYFEQLNDDVR